MRILFDQGTPVPLRHTLAGHDVATTWQRGWSLLSNGDLLAAAEGEGFDLLVTTDQNLRYQQNLAGRRLAILVVMVAKLAGARASCDHHRHRRIGYAGGRISGVDMALTIRA